MNQAPNLLHARPTLYWFSHYTLHPEIVCNTWKLWGYSLTMMGVVCGQPHTNLIDRNIMYFPLNKRGMETMLNYSDFLSLEAELMATISLSTICMRWRLWTLVKYLYSEFRWLLGKGWSCNAACRVTASMYMVQLGVCALPCHILQNRTYAMKSICTYSQMPPDKQTWLDYSIIELSRVYTYPAMACYHTSAAGITPCYHLYHRR